MDWQEDEDRKASRGALVRRHEGHEGILDPLTPDPANDFLWPPSLAMEVALQAEKLEDICEAYSIDRDRWNLIRYNPAFRAEVQGWSEALRREGAAFRARAQAQALELLKENWRIIHDPSVAANIRADMIKNTFKIAGLDASKDQGLGKVGAGGGGFAIHINIS